MKIMGKQILDKKECYGCAACAQACPKHCIRMLSDTEGFLYSEIETEQCINCGLCEKVCPALHPFDKRLPLKTFGAVSYDSELQRQSSSGGVFSLLALNVLNAGGVVFGARFDEQWQVKIDYVTEEEKLSLLRGSKYVQASVGNAYVDAQQFLKDGRLVLFSGTPCQIAGLLSFLNKKYDNLLTVDFACHGVPSPKVWNAYLDAVTRLANKKRACSMLSSFGRNPYMRAFLDNLILRPSCYHCHMKQGRSGSDLTLADFWGGREVCPSIYDDMGTGLVIVNSEKGQQAFERLQIRRQEIFGIDLVHEYNPAIFQSFVPHPQRNFFFSELEKANDVVALIERSLRPHLKQRIKQTLRCIKQWIRGLSGAYDDVFDDVSGFPKEGWTKDSVCSVTFRSKHWKWEKSCMEIKWKNKK